VRCVGGTARHGASHAGAAIVSGLAWPPFIGCVHKLKLAISGEASAIVASIGPNVSDAFDLALVQGLNLTPFSI
jgi:hypothetical protein